MKKQLIVVVMLLALLVPIVVVAKPSNAAEKTDQTNVVLYLFEKEPSGDWQIVEGGAWGKLNLISGAFNGHGLEPNTDYCLINYVDPWGSQNTILASGTSNKNGGIHLMADVEGVTGKIWLILDEDINDSGYMVAWHPTEYLFEHNLLPVE